ncbi:hypothetical protein ACFZAV_16305 [Streptomyces sp. NPDC008343]|uniref:hypothetical protein n=1 Tax=Streptomyces sp. NPDC008343 TaxID=3364828 RepID=UPI0036EFEFAC
MAVRKRSRMKIKKLFGTRLRRRIAAAKARSMPQRLRQDLQQALALRDDADRRTAVDRVVQGITKGTYGTTFQRQADNAARRRHTPS